MARWILVADDQVVWYGDTKDRGQVQQLIKFMDEVMDNELPNAYPRTDKFNAKDWRHLVRASIAFVTDFYGVPTLESQDFTIDDIIPEPDTQPEDAVN